ncbi:MAG: hypothetical protein WBW37_14930, partial [Methyloceanibacter sp.]
AMASSSFTRCPTDATPSSFRSLVRQARENRLVYVILAECRLVPPEAQAPQPDHNVHDGRPTIMVAHIICWSCECVQGGVGGSQGFAKPAEVWSL